VGLFSRNRAPAKTGEIDKSNIIESEFKANFTAGSDGGEKSASIDAYVAAPNFEIESDMFANFPVPLGGSAPPAVFRLKGIEAGSTTITIDFYQDPDYLGSVSIETEVEAATVDGTVVG